MAVESKLYESIEGTEKDRVLIHEGTSRVFKDVFNETILSVFCHQEEGRVIVFMHPEIVNPVRAIKYHDFSDEEGEDIESGEPITIKDKEIVEFHQQNVLEIMRLKIIRPEDGKKPYVEISVEELKRELEPTTQRQRLISREGVLAR